jgi:hypothetical protein
VWGNTSGTKFSASKEQKRGLRFPTWQVTSEGLLPELSRLFEVLGIESWTVYRFLAQPKFRFSEFTLWAETGALDGLEPALRGRATAIQRGQHHPGLDGDTALSASLRGKVERSPRCSRKYRQRLFLICRSPLAYQAIQIEQNRTRADQNWNQVVPAGFVALPRSAWIRVFAKPVQ